jgi:hypothetical protein
MSLIGKLRGQRARHHCRIEVERGQLIEKSFDIERMMQRNRSAEEEPWHERDCEASERAQRQRREQRGLLLKPAFEHHGQAAGDQFGVAARHRNEAVGCYIPRDDCKVGARTRIPSSLLFPCRDGIDFAEYKNVIEGTRPSGGSRP